MTNSFVEGGGQKLKEARSPGQSLNRCAKRVRVGLLTLIILSLTSQLVQAADPTPVDGYTILNTYPHDTNAFTQGLLFADGVLYEGTGLTGRSSLRRVDLTSGTVLQQRTLPNDQQFGEGVTLFDGKLYQLTWQAKTAYLYDKESFTLLDSFSYPTQGWGLTHDGQYLIMSDGTPTIYFRDPQTFAEVRQITVYDEQGPVSRLNELEYIEGEIYANVWHTDLIARIDPATGQITRWLDLTGLLEPGEVSHSEAVLNGIAYDAHDERLFVTGKLWPKLFEIEIVPDAVEPPSPPLTYTLYLPLTFGSQ